MEVADIELDCKLRMETRLKRMTKTNRLGALTTLLEPLKKPITCQNHSRTQIVVVSVVHQDKRKSSSH